MNIRLCLIHWLSWRFRKILEPRGKICTVMVLRFYVGFVLSSIAVPLLGKTLLAVCLCVHVLWFHVYQINSCFWMGDAIYDFSTPWRMFRCFFPILVTK